ncbi:MAG: hypothetical protein LBU12_05895 [Deltaproteobacteria bacterium]|jgi:hypothetical protein|nr:hypothetical protein [Deltaproteobacteria bacterium]
MQYNNSNGNGNRNEKSHFDNLEKRFISIENSIYKIKCDVRIIQNDINIIKSDVSIIKSDINIIQSDVRELKRFRWIFTGFIFAGFAIGIAIILIIVNMQSKKLYEASERQIYEVVTKLEIWETELNDIFKESNAKIELIRNENK